MKIRSRSVLMLLLGIVMLHGTTYAPPHSPEGAGVGPAQFVGFPHQETSKDPVEDVPLLNSTHTQTRKETGQNMTARKLAPAV